MGRGVEREVGRLGYAALSQTTDCTSTVYDTRKAADSALGVLLLLLDLFHVDWLVSDWRRPEIYYYYY